MKKIGILASYTKKNEITSIPLAYLKAIAEGGNTPFIIPCYTDSIEKYVDNMDGFLIPGGSTDIEPLLYGEKRRGSRKVFRENDIFLIDYILKIIDSGKPLLGICRGMQIINVALGGSLIQDIPDTKYSFNIIHKVQLEKNSRIFNYFNKTSIEVNSLHHQAVKNLGNGLIATGYNKEGIIEAYENETGNVLGVQWHPEYLNENKIIFKDFFK